MCLHFRKVSDSLMPCGKHSPGETNQDGCKMHLKIVLWESSCQVLGQNQVADQCTIGRIQVSSSVVARTWENCAGWYKNKYCNCQARWGELKFCV